MPPHFSQHVDDETRMPVQMIAHWSAREEQAAEEAGEGRRRYVESKRGSSS